MGDQGPVYFFKESHPEWGFLCQWYPGRFMAENSATFTGKNGITFKSPAGFVFHNAEQYMMWHKAMAFNDQATAKEILFTSSPRKCKGLGRNVTDFDAEVWDQIKSAVVEEGSYRKFSWNQEMKEKLLATGNRELVEASQFDRVWGVGFSVDQCCQGKRGPAKREYWGQNLLGKALMVARQRIRDEEEAKLQENAEKEVQLKALIRNGK